MPAPRVNPQESGTDGWDDGVVYDGVPITVATEILQNECLFDEHSLRLHQQFDKSFDKKIFLIMN